MRLTQNGARELAQMRWGLLDSWSTPGQTGHINARSESVMRKPAFSKAFSTRRCLVPADGFFEWQKAGGVSHPYYVRRRDHGLFALAGIWEPHPQSGETFAVLTCEPAERLRHVHDRMPVMLRRQQCETWLDPEGTPEERAKLLAPYPNDLLELVQVGRTVNSVANDSPACIEAQEHRELQGKLF